MIETIDGKKAAPATMSHRVTRAIDDQLKGLDMAAEGVVRQNNCIKAFITKVKDIKLTEEEAEGFLLMASR
jgi:hypothetical protein